MSVDAQLVSNVILTGARAEVQVSARGVGVLHIGAWRRRVWGRFDGVIAVDARAPIAVRFGRDVRRLFPRVIAAPAVPTALVKVAVPNPSFDIVVVLPRGEYEPSA